MEQDFVNVLFVCFIIPCTESHSNRLAFFAIFFFLSEMHTCQFYYRLRQFNAFQGLL